MSSFALDAVLFTCFTLDVFLRVMGFTFAPHILFVLRLPWFGLPSNFLFFPVFGFLLDGVLWLVIGFALGTLLTWAITLGLDILGGLLFLLDILPGVTTMRFRIRFRLMILFFGLNGFGCPFRTFLIALVRWLSGSVSLGFFSCCLGATASLSRFAFGLVGFAVTAFPLSGTGAFRGRSGAARLSFGCTFTPAFAPCFGLASGFLATSFLCTFLSTLRLWTAFALR
ncbi:MAG: hypothetical protein U0R19_27755 [Bryobacteraceae bacterium]